MGWGVIAAFVLGTVFGMWMIDWVQAREERRAAGIYAAGVRRLQEERRADAVAAGPVEESLEEKIEEVTEAEMEQQMGAAEAGFAKYVGGRRQKSGVRSQESVGE